MTLRVRREQDVWGDELRVLHIGAGRYFPDDRQHATFDIWRNLAQGCGAYTVMGRSASGRRSAIREQNLNVELLTSWFESEAEFLVTQFAALKIAREFRPDVIIAQCPALGGVAASLVKARIGARVLIEFHGSHYFSNDAVFTKNTLIQALARFSLPNATRIRALSEGMKQQIICRFGAGLSERIVVLPPRVDLALFRHVRKDWRIEGRPKAIMVGSVTERKGQARFLRAVFESGIDLETWIVGDGPDIPKCVSVADRYGFKDRVKFFGRVSHQELSELLPKADVLVLYSNMEGTPRAIMEGMAAGLPIVTTNAGFASDIVSHGKEGFVLGAQPNAEVTGVLHRLFADEALRGALGAAGRARVEREFSADTVFSRYRALLRETAAS